MPCLRSILSAFSLATSFALAATASAQEYQYPTEPYPTEGYPAEAAYPTQPPPPQQVVPPPPQPGVVAPQLPPQGQWVNTAEYGLVWIPAGASAYAIGGSPYAYLYTPSYGWTWYASPWGWGRCVMGAPWVHRPFPFGFRAWIHGSRGWAWHNHGPRGVYGSRSVYVAPRTVYVAPRPHYGGGGWGHHYVAPPPVRYSAPPARYGAGARYNAPPVRQYNPPPVYNAPRPAPAPSYSAPRSHSGWGGSGRYGAVQATPAPSPRYGAGPASAPSPGRYGAGPARAPQGGGGRGGRMGGHHR